MEFKRIRNIREDTDTTQKEISDYLKITKQQYSLYENGKRTIPIDLLIKLSKYYHVSIDYLVGISDKKKTK